MPSFYLKGMEENRSLQKKNDVFLLLMVFISFFYSLLAFGRNIVWIDGISLWYDVVISSPLKARAHSEFGNVYFRSGLFDKSIEEHLIAIKLDPSNKDIVNNAGNAYTGMGRFDEAIEMYSSVLQRVPNHIAARNNRGSVYYLQGRFDEAIEEFIMVLSINPNLLVTRYHLGVAYKKKGLNDQAIREFEHVLRFIPRGDYEAVRIRKELDSIKK